MRLTSLLYVSLTLAAPAFPQATHWLYSATGGSGSAIQAEVDRFRRDLGDLNPNQPNSFPAGRREINWDGVGGTLGNNNLPGDFFHKTSPRGLVMSTPGLRLKVSGDQSSPSFNMRDVTRDESGMEEFQAFSGDKAFAPIGGTVTDVQFRIPGTDDVACVSAFGAVFMDIDRAGTSGLEVMLTDGTVKKFLAPVQPVKSKGFSFLGVRFAPACIAHVRVINGDKPIDIPDLPVPDPDAVALDDFIYSEPTPIAKAVY